MVLPIDVPLNITFAPIRGLFFSSTIFPDIKCSELPLTIEVRKIKVFIDLQRSSFKIQSYLYLNMFIISYVIVENKSKIHSKLDKYQETKYIYAILLIITKVISSFRSAPSNQFSHILVKPSFISSTD